MELNENFRDYSCVYTVLYAMKRTIIIQYLLLGSTIPLTIGNSSWIQRLHLQGGKLAKKEEKSLSISMSENEQGRKHWWNRKTVGNRKFEKNSIVFKLFNYLKILIKNFN